MLKEKKQKNNYSEKGFTLVEMLVSIALFSIVLVVMLGSILTIVDVNRKSQSLTIVMNDLNFALESLTRTIKTGQITDEYLNRPDPYPITFLKIEVVNQNNDTVLYEYQEKDSEFPFGRIERSIKRAGQNNFQSPIILTSSQIDITQAEFTVFAGPGNKQPRVLILLNGTVYTSPRISSDFTIQTTVSQRRVDFSSLYNN